TSLLSLPFHVPSTTVSYTLSLHDALPICAATTGQRLAATAGRRLATSPATTATAAAVSIGALLHPGRAAAQRLAMRQTQSGHMDLPLVASAQPVTRQRVHPPTEETDRQPIYSLRQRALIRRLPRHSVTPAGPAGPGAIESSASHRYRLPDRYPD